MRLQAASDLHLEFLRYQWELPEIEADALLLAGDIGLKGKGLEWLRTHTTVPVAMIPGNHEFYGGHYETVLRDLASLSGPRVRCLLPGSHWWDFGPFYVYGMTLWTDLNLNNNIPLVETAGLLVMNDFKKIRCAANYRKFLPADMAKQHRWEVKEFVSFMEVADKPVVVVTHHAPHRDSVGPDPNGYGPLYASNLEALILTYTEMIPLWVHGHIHKFRDYTVGNTRVLCNPKGYPGEDTGWVPNLVVNVC